MSTDYLQKKKEIENRFNQLIEEAKQLQEQAQALQQRVMANNTERARLQGAFALLEDLQKKGKPKEPTLKPPKQKK